MATLVYTLSNKSNVVPGKKEVLVRFFHGKFNQRGKTRVFVDESQWDSDRQCNRIPKIRVMSDEKKVMIHELEQQNITLNNLSAFLKQSFVSENGDSSLPEKWVVNKITEFYNTQDSSETLKEDSMLNVFERYIEIHNMAESQKRQYRVIYRALKRFALYSNISIEFADFTADTLRAFEDFMLKEHTFIGTDEKGKPYINNDKYQSVYDSVPECRYPKQRGKNTIIKLMSRFRTFIRWAIKNKYMSHYPFVEYEMGTAIFGTPYYLTKDERNTLYKAKFPNNPALEVQRDIFIFQSFIGCRIGDLMKMTKTNIINGAIEYIPRKTKEGRPVTVRVPLSPTAKEILDKYPDVPDDKLLPFISEQKYNKAIKEMIQLAGIDRIVTTINTITREEEKHPIWEVASSHMARRNLIGNLYREVQDPNLIAKISGHTENSKAFNRYRDIDEEMAKEVILKLE